MIFEYLFYKCNLIASNMNIMEAWIYHTAIQLKKLKNYNFATKSDPHPKRHVDQTMWPHAAQKSIIDSFLKLLDNIIWKRLECTTKGPG